ncbi:uncharacterized protein Z518_00094 [Rhinocladiella mackenziei CBS 650.93]|uniref:PD-(D/E)XK nuclease-like domain-containing protein n=1 Tax=Rhinocladiella mackenziei CBS 650.93 TaxID=1442369 RepID=A0A0D2J082_9EURO|nr:uncharacterized protein Z518_00094 [Rhinocladiella mackenziei CBS 650.93]KIX09016.1 hypothetical protein Z518_00094 [Rhinocladiella mackenziei CBS 650.93]
MCSVVADRRFSPNPVVAAWVHDVCVSCDLDRYIFQHEPTSGAQRKRKTPPLEEPPLVSAPKTHRRRIPPKKKRARNSKEGEDNAAAQGDLTPRPPRAKRSNVAQPDNDADLTPRPRAPTRRLAQAKVSTYVPVLQTMETPKSRPVEQSDSSAASTKDTSRSPVKQIGDLVFARMPIEYYDISVNLEKLPSDARDLYKKLRAVGWASSVLPADIKDEICEHVGETDLLLPHMFDEASAANTRSRNQLIRELDTVDEICQATSRRSYDHEAEPSWNCAVHYPILQLALKVYEGVVLRNATTAKICPAFDNRDASGKLLQSKMVDFTINLAPDNDLRRRILEFLEDQLPSLRTVNQTMYHPLRFAPTIVGVETKAPGGSEQDADIQLGVWVSSYFKRIRMLCNNRPVPIALPLLYVQGNQWFSLFACDTLDGTEMLTRLLVGNTNTVLGCYKVMTAIRILSEWGTTSFKQWFESSVLQESVAQPTQELTDLQSPPE